jgi:uncharacterized protein (TIGR03435 family)
VRLIISIVFLAAGWAQTSDVPIRFEVATVKSAADGSPRGWSIHRPAGRFTATNATLRSLLLNAYGPKDYLLQTPGWMENERYDLQAKVPAGATKEQVDVMLQNLLTERFKIQLHREQREFPIYNLVMAKANPNLRESAPMPQTPQSQPQAQLSIQEMMARRGPQAKDKDGFPIVSQSGSWSSTSSDGSIKITAKGVTMEDWAKGLSRQVGHDVYNKTGLTGKYDFRLEYADDGILARGVLPPVPGAAPKESDPSGPTIFKALHDQLGLKLESGKAPMQVVVIDKAEKVPVEN